MHACQQTESDRRSQHPSRSISFLVIVQLVLAVGLVSLAVGWRQSPTMGTFTITFVSIFLEALPFMLLGAMIGGIIEVYLSKTMIARVVPAGALPSVLLAAGLGMLFPVCECAIIPVVRRLYAKGLPLGAGIAFLLGGPGVNLLVALSTAVAYGNDLFMAGWRLAYGYLVAVSVGLLVQRCFSRQSALADRSPGELHYLHDACSLKHPGSRHSSRLWMALHHGASDFIDISRYLVIGAFAAGLLQALVTRSDLVPWLDATPLAVGAMMVLAVVLSLCSEADAFVAASFRTIVPPAAQMAFMVLGPMLDLKLIAMYFTIFKRRLILFLGLATTSIVFLVIMAGLRISP